MERPEVQKWLSFLGVSEDYKLPDPAAVTDPALLIALAAKRCYKAFETSLNPNLSRVRTDWADYLDNVMKSGHGSVLEHSVYSFAIENVSRVFTGEMNRHRAGWAISEGSMRFIRFSEAVPYWEPDSIQGPDVLLEPGNLAWDSIRHALIRSDDDRGRDLHDQLRRHGEEWLPTVDAKKHATRILFERSFDFQRDLYRILELIWKDELAPESKFKQKKELTSLMRRTVGMGCATGGVWTGNIRAIRHVMTMRCEPAAEEEILHVFSRIVATIREREPMLAGDFEKDESGYWRPKYRKI